MREILKRIISVIRPMKSPPMQRAGTCARPGEREYVPLAASPNPNGRYYYHVTPVYSQPNLPKSRLTPAQQWFAATTRRQELEDFARSQIQKGYGLKLVRSFLEKEAGFPYSYKTLYYLDPERHEKKKLADVLRRKRKKERGSANG